MLLPLSSSGHPTPFRLMLELPHSPLPLNFCSCLLSTGSEILQPLGVAWARPSSWSQWWPWAPWCHGGDWPGNRHPSHRIPVLPLTSYVASRNTPPLVLSFLSGRSLQQFPFKISVDPAEILKRLCGDVRTGSVYCSPACNNEKSATI